MRISVYTYMDTYNIYMCIYIYISTQACNTQVAIYGKCETSKTATTSAALILRQIKHKQYQMHAAFLSLSQPKSEKPIVDLDFL